MYIFNQSYSVVFRAFFLHMANRVLISGTTYGPWTLSECSLSTESQEQAPNTTKKLIKIIYTIYWENRWDELFMELRKYI